MPKKKTKKKRLTVTLLKALGISSIFFPGLILAAFLGWDWQPDLVRLQSKGGFKQSKEIFPSEARVVEVKDGDTFVIESGLSVRMLGIDTPDARSPEGEIAKAYLENLIDGERVGLEYESYQDDKYGRILAYVWEDCSTSLGCSKGKRLVNWVLVKEGFAKVELYENRKELKYKDLLLEAEN